MKTHVSIKDFITKLEIHNYDLDFYPSYQKSDILIIEITNKQVVDNSSTSTVPYPLITTNLISSKKYRIIWKNHYIQSSYINYNIEEHQTCVEVLVLPYE
jgi:hypothetical protein